MAKGNALRNTIGYGAAPFTGGLSLAGTTAAGGGGGKKGKPPDQPDPYAVAAAQGQENRNTALYQAGLNNPNVTTPYGSQTYSITPGVNGGAPTVNQNVTLSPQVQALVNAQLGQQKGLSDTATGMLPQVQGALQNQQIPSYASLQDAQKGASDAYYKKQSAYLDPQWQRAQSQQDQSLANQGISLGSQAYGTAKDQFNRDRTFAYDQAQQNAILAGPQVAGQDLALQTAAATTPLNEMNALMSGSQAQLPQFSNFNPGAVAPTPVGQYIYANYAGQQDVYNQQMAAQNNLTGGLFGLGSAGIMAYSDRRLKRDIERIGEIDGLGLYRFRYLWSDEPMVGMMADEVSVVWPHVVHTMPSGYDAIDYGELGRCLRHTVQ